MSFLYETLILELGESIGDITCVCVTWLLDLSRDSFICDSFVSHLCDTLMLEVVWYDWFDDEWVWWLYVSFMGLFSKKTYTYGWGMDVCAWVCVCVRENVCLWCDMTDLMMRGCDELHELYGELSWYDSFMCDVTYSCGMVRIHMWCESFMWDITHSCVRHDAFMWDMIDSDMRHPFTPRHITLSHTLSHSFMCAVTA